MHGTIPQSVSFLAWKPDIFSYLKRNISRSRKDKTDFVTKSYGDWKGKKSESWFSAKGRFRNDPVEDQPELISDWLGNTITGSFTKIPQQTHFLPTFYLE